MRPFASEAASVATVMACKMANLTAAAAAGVDVVVPAGDDNDGFQMPSTGSRSRLIASWTPVHEEMAAAVVAALHFTMIMAMETVGYAAWRGCSCGVCVAAAAADEESPAAVYASWCVEQRTGCWMMAKSWPVVMVVVRRHQNRQMEMELRPGVARGSRPQSAATAGAATCSSMRYDVDVIIVVVVAVAVINRMRSCVQELDQDFVHDLPPPLEPPHAPACGMMWTTSCCSHHLFGLIGQIKCKTKCCQTALPRAACGSQFVDAATDARGVATSED
ncbi:hypothetical protein ACLKA6_012866 [Drosophila palustris]